jgi:glycosyltransferase involved in cell wall biosynthesis
MGRQAAGDSFLRAYLRYSGTDHLHLYAHPNAVRDFAERYSCLVPVGMKVSHIELANLKKLGQVGSLYRPDPGVAAASWCRRFLGNRAYSICGITHTIASRNVMEAIESLCTAPIQAWDALICTSHAARQTVDHVIAEMKHYFRSRLGASPTVDLELPVIPLGIHTDEFSASPVRRKGLREKLGIGEMDIAVLFVGRLTSHAKANPLPMYQALEEAARLTGKRVHLLLSGSFPNDEYKRNFANHAARCAPGILYHVIERPDHQLKIAAYSAADLFISLSDNIQETFGLAPLEAMAAGLPAVVADWNGYRDTVRNGIDGFRVPSYFAPPGSGNDIALRHAAMLDTYDLYIGRAAQFLALDHASCVEALVALIGDANRRANMALAAQRRARGHFDWSVIIGQYQSLWAELTERRRAAREIAPREGARPARPAWEDPFRSFAQYPSRGWDDRTLISRGTNRERVETLVKQPLSNLARPLLCSMAEMEAVLDAVSANQPALPAGILVDRFAPERRWLVRRSLLWMAKFGLIQFSPVAESESAGAT